RGAPADDPHARRGGDPPGHAGGRSSRPRTGPRAHAIQRHRRRTLMDIRFLGHAAFALEHGGKTVLIDPFLTGNPKAAASADEVAADAILLTHGHADHFGDTMAIA